MKTKALQACFPVISSSKNKMGSSSGFANVDDNHYFCLTAKVI